MPVKSQAQRRWLHWAESAGKLPKGTARRWEDHTPKGKLPERVNEEKKAFVSSFILKCAAAGITDPADVANAAEQLLAKLQDNLQKQAGAGSSVAGGLTGAALAGPIIGSVALPLAGGFALGAIGGQAQNTAERDDLKVLRMHAEANAYRRLAAQAKTHAQVRRILASDPKKYILIG